MRIGSLFSGIGGLELGLEASIPGAHTAWQVECNPYARRVLEQHWPDADRSVLDVRTATRDRLSPVDLICGGFPCTDLSIANPNATGLAGRRSGLWFEFERVVAELRPVVVVVENSPGLVRRGLDTIVTGLVQQGFKVEATRLTAEVLGAWHQRERLFVVAWNASHPDRKHLRFEPERCEWAGWNVGTAVSRDPEPLDDGGIDGWNARPALARVDHGVPSRLDRHRWRVLGNAVVPACARVVGHRIVELLQ